jgi:hypothetical protein
MNIHTINNNQDIDYVIIGGGPTGLTIAYYLNKYGKKCILIDKNNDIGGCHRVNRIDDLFVEHGPRVYSDAYVNFRQLLKEWNYNFYDLFVKYDFQISNIGGKSIQRLNIREITLFILQFIKLILGNDNSKFISVKEFLDKNNFSDISKDYLDRVCRLTDGAGSDRTSLFQFLQLINQNSFYNLYQPSKPNDKLLFKIWKEKLINVPIYLNTTVSKINISYKDNQKYIDSITLKMNNGSFDLKAKQYIFCIPPKPYYDLVYPLLNYNENLKLKEVVHNNSYINDIPIIFHWNKKINLNKIWGLSESDWGIAFIVLSNYMNFEDDRSQTVISTCITRIDSISKYTNKTANQTNDKYKLIDEVFRQLKLSYPDLPSPTYSMLNQGVYRFNNQWIETDTAFVSTKFQQYINDNQFISLKDINNLNYVGTHNGNSNYYFTTLESAVQNALYFLNKNLNIKIQIKKPLELIYIIRLVLLIIIIVLIYKFYLKKSIQN